jgi:YHS domain-containing protein
VSHATSLRQVVFVLAAAAVVPALSRAQAIAPQSATAAPQQHTKRLVNLDQSGLALQGYDPVAFFSGAEPMPGKPELSVTYFGATYRFASAANKAAFEADPMRYEPAFGGYCAYGVSEGGLFPVDIRTAQIVDGRLVLNKNLRVKELFDRNRPGRMRLADGEWPRLVQRHGH